jgi:indolepyruvate ferredoxin oxidoreductase beta subunit
MKLDVIIAGVGGQGILSISAVIGEAAVRKGLYFKQAEVHGMSQRGGEVQSHLRISDKPIYSDLLEKGKAGMIISIEPMEGLRYLPFLNQEGWIITNDKPFVNIPNYPPIEDILAEVKKQPRHILINASDIANEVGSPLVMNMVMLGASSSLIPLDFIDLENAIKTMFSGKGDKVVEMNLAAIRAGKAFIE